MSDAQNVYQRFSLACTIIDGQAWVLDLENKQYKSIPIDSMRAGVRKACVKAGLVHVGPYDITWEDNFDGRMHRYSGACKFKYINIDKPEEYIEFESIGEAMDPGDKGIGKFVTNCIKNHYKSAFDIGEQNEDDLDSYSNEEMYERAKKQAPTKKNIETEDQGKALARACKKAINDWLNDDPLGNASHEVIGICVERHGLFDEWDDGIYIQCYKELKAANVKGLAEVVL